MVRNDKGLFELGDMRMKKMVSIFGVALVMTVFILLSGCGKNNYSEEASVKVGDVAPDFTVTLSDKTTFSLQSEKDKVIVLNIWATWCKPCCEELPAFEKLQNEYGDKIKVIAVNCGEKTDVVDSFIQENGYTFSFAYDENAKVNELYPTQGIPYTVIIDKNGIVRNTYIGASTAEAQYEIYKEAIDEVLNE